MVARAGTSSLPYCFEHRSSSGVFDLATRPPDRPPRPTAPNTCLAAPPASAAAAPAADPQAPQPRAQDHPASHPPAPARPQAAVSPTAVIEAAPSGRPGSRPGRTRSKSNSSRAGPFAGPKPEPMTVPRGATRSNRRAHPSRLGWARGFLPSWPCEFDSRHPLHSKSARQREFAAMLSCASIRAAELGPLPGPLVLGRRLTL
jgi:hypothetical protein